MEHLLGATGGQSLVSAALLQSGHTVYWQRIVEVDSQEGHLVEASYSVLGYVMYTF